MVSRALARKALNLALLCLLALSALPLGTTRVAAQGCLEIQSVGFNKPPPFANGNSVDFGVTIANNCPSPQTAQVQCYIDGQLWDSGPISLSGGQSTTLWSDNSWTASSGSHTLIFTAGDSSLSRSFDVLGVPPEPNPSSNWSVWTDKSTYFIGDTITIRVSPPIPGVGATCWLIIRDPSNNQSRMDLRPGQDTIIINAAPPTGSYGVELWGIGVYPNANPELLASCSFEVKNMQPTQYSLTITINGCGNTNPNAGTYSYNQGDQVTINANPCSGWVFDHWGGGASGTSGSTTVYMNSNKSVTAYFVEQKPVQYSLTITINGCGNTNPNAGTYSYNQGDQVTINANPCSGWVFDHWGGNISGYSTSTSLSMSSNKAVTAYFKQQSKPKYTLTISTVGNGDTNPSAGTYTYNEGDQASITANPDTGWVFDHWGGGASGYSTSTTITMNSNKAVTAYFKQPSKPTHTLIISTVGNGDTDPSAGTYTYKDGDKVTITAKPNTGSGWVFSHWGGDASGTSSPKTLQINSNESVTAYFVIGTADASTNKAIEQHISKYFNIKDLREAAWEREGIYFSYGWSVYYLNEGKTDKIEMPDFGGLLGILEKFSQYKSVQTDYSALWESVTGIMGGINSALSYAQGILNWMKQIENLGDAAAQDTAAREGRTYHGDAILNGFIYLAQMNTGFFGQMEWDNPENGLIVDEVHAWDQKDYAKLIPLLDQEASAIDNLTQQLNQWGLREKLLPYTEDQKDAFANYKKAMVKYLESDATYVKELRKFLTTKEADQ